jgi:hypothetical protein
MNRLPLFFFALVLLISCNDSEKTTEKKADNDMDAAANFLNACLQGNFRDAATYMLQDSTNTGYLFYTERMYNKQPEQDKKQLKEASLHFYNYPNPKPNDSTTIVVFSNSLKNDKDTLRIIKTSGRWLVDLKYLFLHGEEDSSEINIHQPAEKKSRTDSTK